MTLFSQIKNIARKSVVYGLGSIIINVLGFLLLPLYTRYLTLSDYGVMAVTNTILSVLGLLLPLGLHGAVSRFYFLNNSEVERKKNIGTIWIMMLFFSLIITLLLDMLGKSFFAWSFPSIDFQPYIRLTIWSSFLGSLSLVPLVLLQVKEQPSLYIAITISNTLVTISLTIYSVVLQNQGVYGYLLSQFFSKLLFTIPYIYLTLNQITISFRIKILKSALSFSLPLVPHSLANWVLELSDRAILQQYVTMSALGLYSVGYQMGNIINLFATAINYAWVPFLYKIDAEHGEDAKHILAGLTTYYVLTICFVALGLNMFVKELFLFMTTPNFYDAYSISHWIIWGIALRSLYFIPVNFLFLREKTTLIPIITVISSVANLGSTFYLVSQYGIMGAAWATVLSYSIMLMLAWHISLRVYTLPYEYKRLAKIALTTIILWSTAEMFSSSYSLRILIFKFLLFVSYPFVLFSLGFFSLTEIQKLRMLISSLVYPKSRKLT